MNMGKFPKKGKGKLPSGSVRVQVYWYTDDNGKRHYKSFTAPTRKEALEEANRWKVLSGRAEPKDQVEDISVKESIKRYIDIKSGVLSQSTLRGYKSISEQYFNGKFGKKKLSEVNNTVTQVWISELSSWLSPKTVRNVYGLFAAAIDLFSPEIRLKITLPQKKRPDLYCPCDSDIKKILEHIKGTDLEIAVLLAAFGPLRRGEICAITDQDIKGNTIRVSHSMVKGPDKKWYIKQPKTAGSYRDIVMPDFVIQRISGINGYIVKMNPDNVTHKFSRMFNEINVPRFRFHDLRHYAASIMHAIGIPDQYILQRGGWSSDTVMKTVYRNTIDFESARQNKKINQYFEELSV